VQSTAFHGLVSFDSDYKIMYTPVSKGSESATSITSFPSFVYVRQGCVLPNVTYRAIQVDLGHEIIDPTLTVPVRFAAAAESPGFKTATLYTGALGSESSASQTFSAYLRRGFVFAGVTYRCVFHAASGSNYGWEVINPTEMLRCQSSADLAADSSSGSMVVYTGSDGGETSTSVTLSTVYNATSCTLKANKMCDVRYSEDSGSWRIVTGHTT
jgi:hypothetical protein